MYRSGTSLAARVVRLAGVDMGRRVNGYDPARPEDGFEDLEIQRFHEDMLAAAGQTSFSAGEDFAPPRGDVFARRAAALLAARLGPRSWGWRDPKTCLFLDLWQPLVPEASYLFLYRHPVDVVLSLLRRDTEPELRADPRAALRAWVVHNRRLLDFACRHRTRCFVTQAPAITDDVEGFVGRLAQRFKLPLRPPRLDLVSSPEGDSSPPLKRPPWERVIPEALEIYQHLDEIADRPVRPPTPAVSAAARRGSSPSPASEEVSLSESLLYDLLEAHGLRRQQRSSAETFAAALEEERGQLATVREELAAEQARAAELAETLDAITSTRAFGLISRWWRIASRLRR